jgi:hypothetical protein
MGSISEHARIGSVVLRLEQQIGHLQGPRVRQVSRQLAVERPHLAAVGAHSVGKRWAALRVDDDNWLLARRSLDEQLQKRGLS